MACFFLTAMEWNNLEEISQIDQLINESEDQPIAIFKHSTSCGISRMVLKNFERELASVDGLNTKLYFLDLLRYRSISNEIASRLDVIHESPQLIIIEKGLVTHHASHNQIEASALA